MAVRATILLENSVYGKAGVLAEHGWSVWLETDAGAYLFDTGPSTTAIANADTLNVPVEQAQAILISHHHGDHTGGLMHALQTIRRRSGGSTLPVYSHEDLFKSSYIESKDGELGFIGVPHTRTALESVGASFDLDNGWREIAPGLAMTGEIPRRTDFEFGDQFLKHEVDGELIVDPVVDDQTVVIDTPDGLFVVLGCSHAGLINILTYVREQTGKSRFHTIMGGTHLGPVSEDQIAQTITALQDFDIGRIGVSHCTGPVVAARMAQTFGERFFFCGAGTVVES